MCLQKTYEEKKIPGKMNACLKVLTNLFRLYMQLPVNGIPMPKLAICSSSPRIYIVLVSYSNCVPPPTWDLDYFLLCKKIYRIVGGLLKERHWRYDAKLKHSKWKKEREESSFKYLIMGELHLYRRAAINIVTDTNLSKLQSKENR